MKNNVSKEFLARFGTAPAAVYTAPGRVNLIGEHTDYNLGFVLPGAIEKAIYLAIKPNGNGNARVYSLDFDTHISLSLGKDAPEQPWAKYIFGVVKEMEKRGATVGGFDCVFGGDIPLGAGLSSSAALENVLSYALNDIFGNGFDGRELADIGQMTEHKYVEVH